MNTDSSMIRRIVLMITCIFFLLLHKHSKQEKNQCIFPSHLSSMYIYLGVLMRWWWGSATAFSHFLFNVYTYFLPISLPQSSCIQMIDFNSCHISYELVDSYLTSDKGLIIRLSALKDKGFESYKFWISFFISFF